MFPMRAPTFRIVLLLGAWLALAGPWAVCQEVLVRAEKAIDAKDFPTALALLKEHTAKNPNDYRALFDIAYAYTMMGERPQAIAAYRKTLAVRPQLTQAGLNLAILLLEANQAAEAVPYLTEVVAARPKDTRAHLLLGDALAASGNTERALEAYRTVLALDPMSADASLGLGRLHLERKEFADAERHLSRALELKPGYATVRLEMARLWELTGRMEQARALYADLAAKEPGNAAVRRKLGILLMGEKRFAEAAAEFELAAKIQRSPQDDWDLARAYAGARQPDRAIPLLRKLAAANPGDYEVRLLLGSMLMARRDFPAAQAQLEAAVALRPELTDAYVDLANVLYLQSNYPGTLAVLDRVASRSPETAWLNFLRAITLDKLEQVEPALSSYERFLALAGGRYPDQEFQARQRVKALNLRLEKSGKRRKR